jgi:xanthine dehydrogenase accessory factor
MKLDTLKTLNIARRERRAAILVTDTATGEERLVDGEAAGADPLAAGA